MSEEERDHCDIIASTNKKLTAAGFDGLYAPGGECACEVGDIAPCDISEEDGEWINGCQAGYKHLDPRPDHAPYGDFIISCKKEPPTAEEWDNFSYG